MTKIGVLKEFLPERRVSLLPIILPDFLQLDCQVLIEKDAGLLAFATDSDYQSKGASISDRATILQNADVILCIHKLPIQDLDLLKPRTLLMGVYQPLVDPSFVDALNQRKLTAFSLDLLPRSTRAQSMDVLSSMATVAGYKAVILAANTSPNLFPMLMTAAGTITPAKVLILGAGVAGLQAIATARRLGAVVQVFDVRSAVKEEVMSLGAKFIEVEGASESLNAGGYAVEQSEEFLAKQRQAIHEAASKSDIIICTAQIPGKPAPLLVSKSTIEAMKPGSVIIDLAASSGGNCECTISDQVLVHRGITIIGNSRLPSEIPIDSSRLYGKNIFNFIKLFFNSGGFVLNFDDELVTHTCIGHEGEVVSPRLKQFYLETQNL